MHVCQAFRYQTGAETRWRPFGGVACIEQANCSMFVAPRRAQRCRRSDIFRHVVPRKAIRVNGSVALLHLVKGHANIEGRVGPEVRREDIVRPQYGRKLN